MKIIIYTVWLLIWISTLYAKQPEANIHEEKIHQKIEQIINNFDNENTIKRIITQKLNNRKKEKIKDNSTKDTITKIIKKQNKIIEENEAIQCKENQSIKTNTQLYNYDGSKELWSYIATNNQSKIHEKYWYIIKGKKIKKRKIIIHHYRDKIKNREKRNKRDVIKVSNNWSFSYKINRNKQNFNKGDNKYIIVEKEWNKTKCTTVIQIDNVK